MLASSRARRLIAKARNGGDHYGIELRPQDSQQELPSVRGKKQIFQQQDGDPRGQPLKIVNRQVKVGCIAVAEQEHGFAFDRLPQPEHKPLPRRLFPGHDIRD
jgi:hypothetical protein